MQSAMAYVAPAGTPISIGDLAAGIGAGFAGERALRELRAFFASHSGQAHCWPVASGRAAMTLILRAMKKLAPHRTEVLMPGYTCYSVPAAAARAGLTPRLCDIDPGTLGMDPDALRKSDLSNVLAIVTSNLYGLPNALADIESIAAENGVLMLDDAAQSLGATLGPRAVGGFGDAGLYSFDKGKNITTFQGGVIVCRSGRLAEEIGKLWDALPDARSLETLAYVIKLSLYAVMLRPTLYGVVQRMPGLGLGQTIYETEYPIARYSGALAGLALRLAQRLDELNATRVVNARRLEQALAGVAGVRTIRRSEAAHAVFARYPLCAMTAESREAVVGALNRAGVGATRSYPQALIDVPEVSRALPRNNPDQPGARLAARCIITLPTHAYCPADLPSRVRTVVESALRGM